MSDLRVSVCCGAKPRSRNDKMFCASCGWACSVETIAQRDHRMRVEGAIAALIDQGPRQRLTRHEDSAERIVTEWEASNGSALAEEDGK